MSRVAPLRLYKLSNEEKRLDFFLPVVVVDKGTVVQFATRFADTPFEACGRRTDGRLLFSVGPYNVLLAAVKVFVTLTPKLEISSGCCTEAMCHSYYVAPY